jgi:putative spermidine/putrescine transport system permease protein
MAWRGSVEVERQLTMAAPGDVREFTEQQDRPTVTPGESGAAGRRARLWNYVQVVPPLGLFTIFFAVPLLLMFALAFNKPFTGSVRFKWPLSMESFATFAQYNIYWSSAIVSVRVSVLATIVALVLGYPIAHLLAHTSRPRLNTFLLLMVLVSMQLGLVERLYALQIILGDSGLVNQAIGALKISSSPLHLLNNEFSVVVGLVQLSLPFMILSLVGVIQGIDAHVEEVARSLGASWWTVVRKIEIPLARHGLLNGCVLVFAISISSYVVPQVLGGSRVVTLSVNIYQQIFGSSLWQLAAVCAVILFAISLVLVVAQYRLGDRIAKVDES